MPTFKPGALTEIGCEIFEAAGCTPEHTRELVEHLVESSLFGHDSHGVLRFYEYIQCFEKGTWNPRGTPRIVQERPCTAVVDGGGAMGQVGGAFATRLAMRKAREQGMATVTLRNSCHLGRCGAYPLMAAREGMIGLAFVNAGRLGRQVAPYGGIDGKLSTNPIAFAAPRRNSDPIMVDMATSATAEGKIRITSNRSLPLKEGWVIDSNGSPTTDPRKFTGDPAGAILPLGGVAGHKGYCLSFVVELLGGGLSGQGCASGEHVMKSNGVLLTVYEIAHFTHLESYYEDVETLVRHIRTSRIDPDIGEILLPGEFEFRNARKRRADGIEIDDTTWSNICGTAETNLGLETGRWNEMAISI